MNFIHIGQTTHHAIIIPSYNTGARLFDTVAAIRGHGYPVWVIIDGSTDGTGDEMRRIAARDPGLQVFVLPFNLGKGEAVLYGLRLARTQGVTHAVTMDADGQHDANDIDAFVAASRDNPRALILGVPIFDSTAPRIRILGHRIGHFWSDIVTLRAGIGNSLYGFRVYPLAPLLQVFHETRWMRQFDFDSEAAIRLSWRGVPAVNLPTRVTYFRREDGGVSHFKYLRDNALLTFMYLRLFAGLVPRLPGLLVQRFRSSGSDHDGGLTSQ